MSPGGGSVREFRKHKTEIKKLKKELVEIRHSEAPRGSGYETRMMDLNHELKRKQREERRASLRVPRRGSAARAGAGGGTSWGEGLDLLAVYSNFT